jgi:hypothetical protein
MMTLSGPSDSAPASVNDHGATKKRGTDVGATDSSVVRLEGKTSGIRIAPVALDAPWSGPTERWLNGLAGFGGLGTLAALFAIARRDVAARVAGAVLLRPLVVLLRR